MHAVRVGCDGKTAFLSWDHAKRAMGRARFDEKHGRSEMKIYRCRFCRGWHIGRRS